MTRTIEVMIIVLLVFGVGGIWLQIFLSKKESKWAGLILPIITFGISLTALLGGLLFSARTGITTTTVNGEIIEQTTKQIANMSSIIGSAICIFILYNIPTAVLLAIYAACRGKRNRQRALDKMSVQDLE
jgi:cytochrome bd-type quinol oxidase subunit 1